MRYGLQSRLEGFGSRPRFQVLPVGQRLTPCSVRLDTTWNLPTRGTSSLRQTSCPLHDMRPSSLRQRENSVNSGAYGKWNGGERWAGIVSFLCYLCFIETTRETINETQSPLWPANERINASGAYVTFEPGAPPAWHTHPSGQRLVVIAGSGLVQEWASRCRKSTPAT